MIWVGKSKAGFIHDGVSKYKTQLQKYTALDVIECSEVPFSKKPIVTCIKKETESIIKAIPKDNFVVYLDVAGRQMNTEDFADLLQEQKNQSGHVTCIIGGAFGVDISLLQPHVHLRLSLSTMTTSHQMVRLFFLEQLYRGLDIMHGGKYHHA